MASKSPRATSDLSLTKGRQAANGVLLASGYRGAMVKIVGLFQAPWWVPFKVADRARYRARLPNAFDIVDSRWPT